TQLTWVGILGSHLPRGQIIGSYSLDNEPATLFTVPGLPPNLNMTLFNQQFFITPEVPPGGHSLVVTYLGNQNTTPLILDYLYINTSPVKEPHAHGNATGTPTSSPSPGTLPTANKASSSPNDVGAIAGVAIGGVVIILLAIIAIILMKRRLLYRCPIRIFSISADGQAHISSPMNQHSSPKLMIKSPTPGPSLPISKSNNWKGRFLRESSNLSDAYGYDEATVGQTRGMKKGREAVRSILGRVSKSGPHDQLPL
ncbi:hypothetical protein H0H87_011644, partial [Tephrocybe sp. NHM501043]